MSEREECNAFGEHWETQAERIIKKFGGVPELRKALQEAGVPRTESAIYRWSYPATRGGSGGVIPSETVHAINQVARTFGVLLTAEDWDPRPRLIVVEPRPKKRSRKHERLSFEDKEARPKP